MSPLTFAMSTATHNSAQTSSYFIPKQPFLETSPKATRTTHLWVTTSFLSLNSKHDFGYVYSEVYLVLITSHFNSAYLSWRPLLLIPKSTGLPTTGNTPNAGSTLLYLFSFSLRQPAQKASFRLKFYQTSKIENLTTSSFFSLYFPSNIARK